MKLLWWATGLTASFYIDEGVASKAPSPSSSSYESMKSLECGSRKSYRSDVLLVSFRFTKLFISCWFTISFFLYSFFCSSFSHSSASSSSDLRELSIDKKSASSLKNLFFLAAAYPAGFIRTAPGGTIASRSLSNLALRLDSRLATSRDQLCSFLW